MISRPTFELIGLSSAIKQSTVRSCICVLGGEAMVGGKSGLKVCPGELAVEPGWAGWRRTTVDGPGTGSVPEKDARLIREGMLLRRLGSSNASPDRMRLNCSDGRRPCWPALLVVPPTFIFADETIDEEAVESVGDVGPPIY